ncbi:HAD family hydrolase [Streptomyces sp. NPDC058486]|uniref:HAD family hydrolase n=1 Tax=unclassified Streptomyces TaxID=2593676 RepID=UPI0036630843
MKLAIFDVDDTLLTGALGLDLAHALAQDTDVDIPALTRLMTDFAHGDITHDQMTTMGYRFMSRTFHGLTTAQVEHRSQQVWKRAEPRLHHYVRPAFAALRAAGYEICLISGSPSQVVRLLAEELNVGHWYAAEVACRDGFFQHQVLAAPALTGGKHRAFDDLLAKAARDTADLAASLAMGDSPADAEIFERIGHPLAFEPDAELEARALTEGWPIVNRSTALAHLTSLASDADLTRHRP